MIKEKPCIREVNENLRLIEEGKSLNKSLRFLNQSCQFKQRFDALMDIKYGEVTDRKEYYEKNKDRISKKGKEYREKNKDRINKKGKEYEK